MTRCLHLMAEEDGLMFYRILAKEGKKHLAGPGMMFMEIGHDQGRAVKEIFENEGFKEVVVKKDLCENDRVCYGCKIKVEILLCKKEYTGFALKIFRIYTLNININNIFIWRKNDV